ncbi:MAG: MATE family efflux transporter, partial [Solobacterium sp.]|nr:MATE family efflux transporter [Solobacterium sp.]
VYIAGIHFTSIYNVEAGVLRAVGDSRSPFYALVTASLMNIVLDVLLVRYVGLGVLGVAIATVISQLTSVTLVFRQMVNMDEQYRFKFSRLHINRKLLMEVVDLGLPAGIQSSMISISNLFVHRYINSFGSTATAGAGIGQRLDRFVSMPCQALGLSITTFVSQNIGAGKKDRITAGMRITFLLGVASVLIMGIPLAMNSEFFLGLFNKDPGVLQYGSQMIHTLVPFYWLMCASQVLSGSLRGYGYSRQVMFLSLIGMVGVRQLFLYISMHISWDIRNVFIGFPVGWFFQVFFIFLYYLHLKRSGKLDQVFKKTNH